MPGHFADRSSIRAAAAPPATPEGAPPAASPALPGHSAAGSGEDIAKPPGRNFPATANDAVDVTAPAGRVGSTYIYGFDSAGNPTLTEAGERL